jgi:hypothetical protein
MWQYRRVSKAGGRTEVLGRGGRKRRPAADWLCSRSGYAKGGSNSTRADGLPPGTEKNGTVYTGALTRHRKGYDLTCRRLNGVKRTEQRRKKGDVGRNRSSRRLTRKSESSKHPCSQNTVNGASDLQLLGALQTCRICEGV